MGYNLSIHHDAIIEIEQATFWYESRKFGKGFDLLQELDSIYNTLLQNPEYGSLIHKDIRRVVMRKYPYNLYYELKIDTIIILICRHSHRNPDKLITKLKERKGE